MNQFITYVGMGFDHISDLKGYDHMLFIIVLCCVYTVSEWKKVAVLITAFTIGHSTTLALSALKIIIGNSYLIEILIPVTIFVTSIHNLYYNPTNQKAGMWLNYGFALLFGLIHGMGFSNFFNALMGDSMNITFPLFAFNLGLELGQLMVVTVFFGICYVLTRFKEIQQKSWTIFFSGAGAGVSIIMIIERISTN